MAKSKEFKMPYLGFEKDYHLYGLKGEITVCFKITNTALQLEGNADIYENFHTVFLNIVKILGEGHIIQKLDVFSSQVYKENIGVEYLQKKYDDHFFGRGYKQIDTYLNITLKNENAKFNEKKYVEFLNNIGKIEQLLSDSKFKPVKLKERNIQDLIYKILSMDFSSEHIVLDNFMPSETHIQIGENFSKCISLIDIDKIDLPSNISPYIKRGDSEAMKGFPVDNMAFINQISDYKTLIYHQVVDIPNQIKTLQELELKKKRHSGMPDPANEISEQDIVAVMEDIARENQLLVKAHCSFFVCGTEENVTKATNFIETSLFSQGIIPSRSSFNQFELFKTLLPGNAVELKKYDLFLTTSDAALCFFFKEALPVSENSQFFLRYTDRQGIPIKIDPSDLPKAQNKIDNRNKMVFGPSGSGKSFLMNSWIEQYMLYNYDIVIVDVGDSYKGLCSYFGGRYITYTPEKPITMNPFQLKLEELNIEKKEFIATLILLLWGKPSEKITQVEKEIINECINSYYDTFFNSKTDDLLNSYSIPELERYLIEQGVSIKNLFEKARIKLIGQNSAVKNYYGILRVHKDDKYETIKKQYRRLAQKYHPDKNTDEQEIFLEIQEAYDVLSDENKRAEYDKIAKMDEISKAIEEDPTSNIYIGTELETIYREELLAKAKEIADDYKIHKLSFNTFYEFSLKTIPIIMKREGVNFELSDFRYVLKKFYIGGEFDSILNEDVDKSLFTENLIIFEIDNIKDHKVLFPIVTLVIMDIFLQKMRFRPEDMRKALIIEEAWKAIASPIMAGYIQYLYKTVRKFYGEAIIVTQQLSDVIGNETLKDTIIANSDELILLDQYKFKETFHVIADILNLSAVEQRKIFTINRLDNHAKRAPFKEFYFKRGPTGEVYGNEVSVAQYLTYTTEKPEKGAVEIYAKAFGSYPKGLEEIQNHMAKFGATFSVMKDYVNLIGEPLDDESIVIIKSLIKEHKQNTVNYIRRYLKSNDITFKDMINELKQNVPV